MAQAGGISHQRAPGMRLSAFTCEFRIEIEFFGQPGEHAQCLAADVVLHAFYVLSDGVFLKAEVT